MEKYIDYKKDAYLIDLINDSYHYHKMLLKEVENGIKDYYLSYLNKDEDSFSLNMHYSTFLHNHQNI